MQQVTANVYVEDYLSLPRNEEYHGCNRSFVVTSEGIVMIDTPLLPTDAIKWRDDIDKKGKVRYIINTEHHGDHKTGNYFFSGTIVSHQKAREDFSTSSSLGTPEEVRRIIKELDPAGVPLLENYQPRLPTLTFTEQLNIYLGNHTFQLIHLPGHTPGEVGVYIPQERIIFTGDNVINGWQSLLWECCPLEWIESLKRIEAMDVDIVVPGHGQMGDKKIVKEFRTFIQGCIDEVKEAIERGLSKEEAANTISFAGRRPEIHPIAEFQRNNVMRIYEMLCQKR
jgi:cyclase